MKTFVDSLPEEYFRPNRIQNQSTIDKQGPTPPNQVKIGGPSLTELCRLISRQQFPPTIISPPIQLHFPEPSLLEEQDERTQIAIKEQIEKQKREEQVREQKREGAKNVIHPLQRQRKSIYEQSLSTDVNLLQRELLHSPPTSLLNHIYQKEMDSPLVVHMIYQFERNSGQPISEKDKSELLPQTYDTRKPSNNRQHKIQNVESESSPQETKGVSVPDVDDLVRAREIGGIEELHSEMNSLNLQRQQQIRDLESEIQKKQLRLVAHMLTMNDNSLGGSHNQSNKMILREYLQNQFVRRRESMLQEKLRVTTNNIATTHREHIDPKYRQSEPIQFLRSKL